MAADPAAGAPPVDPVGRLLWRASIATAWFGGIVLVAIAGLTMVSVVSRALTTKPIAGDYELVKLGCAMAIFAFLPYCQMRRGNVIVDVVTLRASTATKAALDAVGALLLAAGAGLIAWRMWFGAADLRQYGQQTMELGIPEWPVFVPMIPAAVLLVLVALHSAWRDLSRLRAERA
jgi:TRAP-type C4-dicarboxylate transport system permease small subunit